MIIRVDLLFLFCDEGYPETISHMKSWSWMSEIQFGLQPLNECDLWVLPTIPPPPTPTVFNDSKDSGVSSNSNQWTPSTGSRSPWRRRCQDSRARQPAGRGASGWFSCKVLFSFLSFLFFLFFLLLFSFLARGANKTKQSLNMFVWRFLIFLFFTAIKINDSNLRKKSGGKM